MKNEYIVTRKLYMSWVTRNRFSHPYIWFTLLWGLLAVLFGASAIIFRNHRFYFVLYTIVCVYMALFRSTLQALVQFRAVVRSYGLKGENCWTRSVVFGDEDIVLSDGVCTIRFGYGNLKKIEENGDKIILRFQNKMNIRMFQSTFVEGDWPSCKEMLLMKKQEAKSEVDGGYYNEN